MTGVLQRLGAWSRWIFPFGILLHEYIHYFTALGLERLESGGDFVVREAWLEWTPNPRCVVDYGGDVDLSFVRVVGVAPTALGLLLAPFFVDLFPPLFAYRETGLQNWGLWLELLSLYVWVNYALLIGPSYRDLWIAVFSSDEELRAALRKGVSHCNTPGESGQDGDLEGRGSAVSGDRV